MSFITKYTTFAMTADEVTQPLNLQKCYVPTEMFDLMADMTNTSALWVSTELD